jgi:hypothetical protein
MWNYDSEAFELLVCIGVRLFNKKWASSLSRNESQCMNDLVADLSDTLSRPPSSDGVPYVFSMFTVLLQRKAESSEKRNYFLPNVEEEVGNASLKNNAEVKGVAVDAWSFVQKGFLSNWLSAEEDRRSIMMMTAFERPIEDQKLIATKRAEKKRLEIKWEAIKDVRNEYKQKHLCRVCEKRKRSVAVLPCACLTLCPQCYTDGMVCPGCKNYALGSIEVIQDDVNLQTLR